MGANLSGANKMKNCPETFHYSRWRHGGWYVHNVRYPSGAIGCVSRNYEDRKWRVACSDQHHITYPSRDAAARAEWHIAQKEYEAMATEAQSEAK
jgi:hypothetical protein